MRHAEIIDADAFADLAMAATHYAPLPGGEGVHVRHPERGEFLAFPDPVRDHALLVPAVGFRDSRVRGPATPACEMPASESAGVTGGPRLQSATILAFRLRERS